MKIPCLVLACALMATLPHGSQDPRTPMADIWKLHAEGRSQAVVDAVTPYVADELTPRNRRAACMFLKGDNLRRLGRFDEANSALDAAIDFSSGEPVPTMDTPYGKSAIGPMCELSRVLSVAKETGPYPDSSRLLTALAWRFQAHGQNQLAIDFAERCISTFEETAKQQQAAHLRRFGLQIPKIEPRSEQESEMWSEYWALYDVGTCHFIVGLSCEREAKASSEPAEALRFARKGVIALESVTAEYQAAQCFDENGPWYWRVRDGAEEHLPELRRLVRSLDH